MLCTFLCLHTLRSKQTSPLHRIDSETHTPPSRSGPYAVHAWEHHKVEHAALLELIADSDKLLNEARAREACQDGDVGKLRALLERGVNPR